MSQLFSTSPRTIPANVPEPNLPDRQPAPAQVEVPLITDEQANALRKALDEGKFDEAQAEAANAMLARKGQEVVERTVDEARELIDDAKTPGRVGFQMIRGAEKTARNAGIFGIDILRAVTPEDTAAAAALDRRRDMWVRARDASDAQAQLDLIDQFGLPLSGGSQFFTEAALMAGEVAPYMAAPVTFGAWWRTVIGNAGLGGLAAGIADNDAETLMDRFGEMTWGAAIGGGMAGIFNARSGFQAYSARKLQTRLEDDFAREAQALEAEVQRITGNPDFNFSAGQITANPFIVGLEIGAAREVQREAQLKRMQTLVDFVKLRSNQLRNTGRAEDIASDMNITLDEISSAMHSQASDDYALWMERVIQQWGDEPILRGNTYLNRSKEIMAEFEDPLLGGATGSTPKFLREQIQLLDTQVNPFVTKRIVQTQPDGSKRVVYEVTDRREIEAGRRFSGPTAPEESFRWAQAQNDLKGGLNAEQTKNLLESFRRISNEEVPLFEAAAPGSSKALSGALRRAMLDELESGSRNPNATEAIRGLRQTYAFHQEQIAGMRRSMMNAVFGDIEKLVDPEAAVTAFLTRGQESMAASRQILEEWAPGTLDDMRSFSLRKAVENSRDPTQPASLSLAGREPVNLNKLSINLSGQQGLPGRLASGLWTPRQHSEIVAAGKALQQLQETHLALFPEASTSKVSDVAINLVSRSPEFFARLLARLTASSNAVSRILNDPQARVAVIRLADEGVGSEGTRAAGMYLALLGAETLAQDEREARQDRLEPLLEQIGSSPAIR